MMNNSLSSFEKLRALVAESGPNKVDQAIVVVTACITDGIDTSRNIFEVSARLGLNTRHVAVVLKRNSGRNPDLHRWWQDNHGHYHLID